MSCLIWPDIVEVNFLRPAYRDGTVITSYLIVLRINIQKSRGNNTLKLLTICVLYLLRNYIEYL